MHVINPNFRQKYIIFFSLDGIFLKILSFSKFNYVSVHTNLLEYFLSNYYSLKLASFQINKNLSVYEQILIFVLNIYAQVSKFK